MGTQYSLSFASKTYFAAIDSVPYSIWRYSITWSSSLGSAIKELGILVSGLLAIKDNSSYPDVAELKDTQVKLLPEKGTQFISKTINATDSSLTLCFLAPSQEEPFCSFALGSTTADAENPVLLAFSVGNADAASYTQMLPGPSSSGATATPDAVASGPLYTAARFLNKATLVPLQVSQARGNFESSNAVTKNAYVRQLSLQPGEVDEVKNQLLQGSETELKTAQLTKRSPIWKLLSSVEQNSDPALSPHPSAFATVPLESLRAFGQALLNVRKLAATQTLQSSSQYELGGKNLLLLHKAAVANQSPFFLKQPVAPIGMLNLERLEMTPAGIERGELVGTIPLAPLEETAVTHKEWSVTSKEFTSIVTDSLESVSETGVTDNTELTQSTTSQIQHNNQFNVTGTVSGGIPIISGSTTTTFGAQGSDSQSATDSRKHAVTITQKASSRSKQEHKTTISTKTDTGTSETTTRILKNSSPVNPIRIDYFSMMRKWQVRLYRYGLRLTYDVVIPEPAAAMRSAYAQLSNLRAALGPFNFPLKPSEITNNTFAGESQPHYRVLADLYGTMVPDYPAAPAPIRPNGNLQTDGTWTFFQLEFDVPAGYVIGDVFLNTQIGDRPGPNIDFGVLGSSYSTGGKPNALIINSDQIFDTGGGGFLRGASGHQVVTFFFHYADKAWVGLIANLEPSPDKLSQWQTDVWNALYNAAQMKYLSEQQNIQAQISQIENQLANVDTLTLRREEGDEIMKGVLRFLLGAGFEFMPDAVINAIVASKGDVTHGVNFTGNTIGLDPTDLALVRLYEDTVRFINQAIEWENVVTFLYSYFWDIPTSWDFIRQIRHPDATRQAFLRAGSARVVLTIRKGWEESWVRFEDTFDASGLTKSPYLPIAQEIAAYDDRNYPGIPAANPGKTAVRLEDANYTTSSSLLTASATPVTIDVESSKGFVVGMSVVIDEYDASNPKQESQKVMQILSDTQIVVEKLDYAHGSDGPFPIVQPGEKGVLIAEWNEYTPTSGTDIAVTSNLATIN
jgi:hypothetical protein